MSWKIKFTIKNYQSFENNTELIKLIDNLMIDNNLIFEPISNEININTPLLLWSLSSASNYDYYCKLNLSYIDNLNPDLKKDINKNIIFSNIKNKFKSVENMIKDLYQKYSSDWYIEYKIL